jgi:hypothetical protein
MGRFYWGHLDCPQTPAAHYVLRSTTRTHRRPGPRGQCCWVGRCNDRFVESSLWPFNIYALCECKRGLDGVLLKGQDINAKVFPE